MNIFRRIALFLLSPTDTEEPKKDDYTRKCVNRYWGEGEWTNEVSHEDEYGNKIED